MASDNTLWAIAAFGAGLIFLLRSTPATTEHAGIEQSYSDYDIDNVTRMLFIEAGFKRDPDEMAQIVWVAINRGKKFGQYIGDVVRPDTRPTWYGGISDRSRVVWDEAPSYAKYPAARQFVEDIFKGRHHPNLIGTRTHFLHPYAMPRCDLAEGAVCSAKGAKCVTTYEGKRCIPKWNLKPSANVRRIGTARFS